MSNRFIMVIGVIALALMVLGAISVMRDPKPRRHGGDVQTESATSS